MQSAQIGGPQSKPAIRHGERMDNPLFAQLEKESPSQMVARGVAPGRDLTEAAMATFLYDELVAEKAERNTYKDAHKINVDAGLVTLKRSVALVRHGLRKTVRPPGPWGLVGG